jgi:hypothetical protein
MLVMPRNKRDRGGCASGIECPPKGCVLLSRHLGSRVVYVCVCVCVFSTTTQLHCIFIHVIGVVLYGHAVQVAYACMTAAGVKLGLTDTCGW